MRMIAAPLSSRELAHQLEDLRLDGDVERGRRLVGDEELGIAGERHRDHDALAHAAGELVRVVVEARLRRRDADAAQHLDRRAPAASFRETSRWRTIASTI